MPCPSTSEPVAAPSREAGSIEDGFDSFTRWENLLDAWVRASRGKHGSEAVARYAFKPGEHLLRLQRALQIGNWCPGAYVQFAVHESRTGGKRRWISAAPFADRVVHHALLQVIEPRFERGFSGASFANRVGFGTHRAVKRLQTLARQHRHVLRLDVQRHFPSIDHAILLAQIFRRVPEPGLRGVVRHIVDSGLGVHDPAAPDPGWLFPGDDLLTPPRPKGLPVGNLTSQHWSNVYLHALDEFCERTLRAPGYLRYVDDFALFHDDKVVLAEWRGRIQDFLATRLRLRIHERAAHVQPCNAGIPWLGFVVHPGYMRVKARKVVQATRHLTTQYDAWCEGRISFGEFDASVQGWIQHVSHADTLGLREHVLGRFELAGMPGRRKAT